MENMNWILLDTYEFADDNCEHFYRFLREKHPEINICYLLNSSSKDYQRLKKDKFNLISKYTQEFYNVLNKSNVVISSQLLSQVCKGYDFSSKKVVFIPHGITLGDSSRYFNKGDFDLCTSCIENEYKSYISGEYNYKANKSVFKLTGMPRHDILIKKMKNYKKKKEKVISFVFTYRSKKEDTARYYSALNKLFNCDYFKEINKKYNIKFQVKFHPWITRKGYEGKFNLPSFIKNCRDISYQEFLLNTDILISDYSSACQEFAVIGRNILYYQFDRDEFLSKKSTHSYDLGWFDWDKDSLGKICLTQTELCNSIDDIIKNNFEVDKIYKERMKSFFKYNDTKSCERVYDAILETIKKPKSEPNPNYKKPKEERISDIQQLRKDIREGRVFKVYLGNGQFGWKKVR